MSKKAFQTLEKLKSALAVGIVTSLGITALTYNYYMEKVDVGVQSFEHGGLFNTLEFLEQKALDIRFLLRGPITPKENIAVLAVDDASITQLGRWPWSRDLTADLIDRLMNNGAKVLGFDMVFSEPQIEKTEALLNEIERTTPLPPGVIEKFNEAKLKSRPDDILSSVFKKHREKLVLGAFNDDLDVGMAPYQDLCYDRAFRRTDGFALHEIETLPLFVFNDYYSNSATGYLFENIPFEKIMNPIFDRIELEIQKKELETRFHKATEDQLTPQEVLQLSTDQKRAVIQYCSVWLNPKLDPYFREWQEAWPNLVAENKILKGTTLTDELPSIRSYFLINPVIESGLWTINTPKLRVSTDHNAMFSALLDSDGTIRRSPLFYRAGVQQENYLPSLAFQTFLVARGWQAHITLDTDKKGLWARKSDTQFAVRSVEIKNPETDQTEMSVPVDHRGILKINYAGPQMSFPYLSATELFHNRDTIRIQHYLFNSVRNVYEITEKLVNRKEFIKDRIFILGVTAVAHYDLRTIPFAKNFPGVETHVNVLSNLLSKDFIFSPQNEIQWVVGSLIVFGLLASTLLHLLNAALGFLSMGAIITILGLVDRALFAKGIVFGTVFIIIEVSLIYLTMTAYKYFTEEKNKRHLKSTFSKYVSPAIVDEILADPENIQLGGRKQNLTIFFSDVRGFTQIAEKLDPQVLTEILNEYLTPMTNIVFSNRGTLDKYMGDAIMAFFGAPIPFDDHAKSACRCAIQSLEKLAELQVSLQDRGLPLINIGIGINTADVSVGNMGSDIVRNYTVMGDGVNLASRLEGTNKVYGTAVIISEQTYAKVADSFVCRELDRVRVKGKQQPVRIFELMAENPATSEQLGLIEAFSKAYHMYHNRQFKEAKSAFEMALQWKPNDPVCLLYINRCQVFETHPPEAQWDGVFEMKSK